MSIRDAMSIASRAAYQSFSFNTGCLYDLQTGGFVCGYDNKYYIDGGINRGINALAAKEHRFKSTMMISLIHRAMNLIPGSELILRDVEESVTRDMARYYRLGRCNIDPSRIIPIIGSWQSINDLYKELRNICKYKEEHRKDLLIKLPIIDPNTGKQAMAYMPTFVAIDTWSALRSAKQEDLITTTQGLDDQKARMIFMSGGLDKTVFNAAVTAMCSQYGIYIFDTVHVGLNSAMDPMDKPSKALEYMAQNEKLKEVGSNFLKLTIPLVDVASAKPLTNQADRTQAEYGEEGTTCNDLNEVVLQVQRGKTNISGMTCSYVVSQSDGLDPDLTNFHFLRSNGYFGLLGPNSCPHSALFPSVNLRRNSVRDTLPTSYELRRSLELMAHLLFIKSRWNWRNLPIDLNIEPERLCERLTGAKTMTLDRVLNSRGYWTTGKGGDHDREYLSILDVLGALEAEQPIIKQDVPKVSVSVQISAAA